MILADTSAWVEYLRATGSALHLRMRGLMGPASTSITITDVVVMEVLAGARDEAHRNQLRSLLGRHQLLAVAGLGDYESAADLYRICRRGGETVRKITDCLIAVVAIREGVPVLHGDADFDAIARQSPLQISPVTAG